MNIKLYAILIELIGKILAIIIVTLIVKFIWYF